MRIQFDFEEESIKELETLRAKLNLRNRGDVLLHSLGLLKWLVRELREGSRIKVSRKNGTETEVVFTHLESLVMPSDEKSA